MDQVKYLKLEKNLKNGTVRTHGPAGKYHKAKTRIMDPMWKITLTMLLIVDRLVLINLETKENQ